MKRQQVLINPPISTVAVPLNSTANVAVTSVVFPMTKGLQARVIYAFAQFNDTDRQGHLVWASTPPAGDNNLLPGIGILFTNTNGAVIAGLSLPVSFSPDIARTNKIDGCWVAYAGDVGAAFSIADAAGWNPSAGVVRGFQLNANGAILNNDGVAAHSVDLTIQALIEIWTE